MGDVDGYRDDLADVRSSFVVGPGWAVYMGSRNVWHYVRPGEVVLCGLVDEVSWKGWAPNGDGLGSVYVCGKCAGLMGELGQPVPAATGRGF